MKKYRFHVKAAMLGTLLLTFPACEGLFDDIYDNPSEANLSTNGFGFVEVSPETHSGTLYVNSSDYTQWVYIDLHSLSVDSTRILNEAGEEISLSDKGTLPQEWDFAIHRYDTKTNEGAVLETSAESMEELLAGKEIPQGNYTADTPGTTDKITIDLSDMYNGTIRYACSDYNSVLSQWLSRKGMPPTYILSGKVYVLQLKDGTHAALKLTDYRNEMYVNGYMRVQYIYPLENALK